MTTVHVWQPLPRYDRRFQLTLPQELRGRAHVLSACASRQSRPIFSRDTGAWHVAKPHLRTAMQRLLGANAVSGLTFVRDFSVAQKCTGACSNADATYESFDDCACSCGGRYHGHQQITPEWMKVGDDALVAWDRARHTWHMRSGDSVNVRLNEPPDERSSIPDGTYISRAVYKNGQRYASVLEAQWGLTLASHRFTRIRHHPGRIALPNGEYYQPDFSVGDWLLEAKGPHNLGLGKARAAWRLNPQIVIGRAPRNGYAVWEPVTVVAEQDARGRLEFVEYTDRTSDVYYVSAKETDAPEYLFLSFTSELASDALSESKLADDA